MHTTSPTTTEGRSRRRVRQITWKPQFGKHRRQEPLQLQLHLHLQLQPQLRARQCLYWDPEGSRLLQSQDDRVCVCGVGLGGVATFRARLESR